MRIFPCWLISALLLYSCMGTQNQEYLSGGKEFLIDSANAQSPYLTVSDKGETVLSWIRINNDSSTAFCYVFTPDGKHFSLVTLVPNSFGMQPHGENLPKIVFKPDGTIIAVWGVKAVGGRNKYAGRIIYAQSFDGGINWTRPMPLVDDPEGQDQRYFDLAILPGGEAGIIWLDDRKTVKSEGSALYFASTEGKTGFGLGRLVSEPTCQCCRTDLFVDKKGVVHIMYRAILQDSIRDMVHVISYDRGKTFTPPERISEDNWAINGCPHTGPAMTENESGIHFAWYTGGNRKGCFYGNKKEGEKKYSKAEQVNDKGSHPQLAATNNGDIVLAWDEQLLFNNKVSRRIGIEQRRDDGRVVRQFHITDEKANSAYPVISSLKNGKLLVAYIVEVDGQSRLAYQLLDRN